MELHFHHTTKRGTAFCGDLVPMTGDNYVVVLCSRTLDFEEQIVFVFRSVCHHPALSSEYVAVPTHGGDEVARKPLDHVIPKRVLTDEMSELRDVAASQVEEVLSFFRPVAYFEPSEQFKQALDMIRDVRASLEADPQHKALPDAMVQAMKSNLDTMAKDLRNAANAKMADHLAGMAINILSQLDFGQAAERNTLLN